MAAAAAAAAVVVEGQASSCVRAPLDSTPIPKAWVPSWGGGVVERRQDRQTGRPISATTVTAFWNKGRVRRWGKKKIEGIASFQIAEIGRKEERDMRGRVRTQDLYGTEPKEPRTFRVPIAMGDIGCPAERLQSRHSGYLCLRG